MLRRLAVAAVVVMVGFGLVAAAASIGGAQGAAPAGAGVETRPVCGPQAGPFARCHAIQVLNPNALAHNHAKGGKPGPPSTTVAPTTTTAAPTTTTVAPTTTTAAPTTTTAAPTTTTAAPTTTTAAPTTTTAAPTTTTAAPTTTTAAPTTTTAPSSGCTTVHNGLTPCDLQAAYQLPSVSGGTGKTVAIVDAYDDPKAEADLAVYRAAYNLPACTTANGCFRKVNQSGGTTPPSANTGWAEEISLDVDMVSAVCQNCKILLVEANSNSLSDLLAAEATAANLGADVISNSWGAGESLFETGWDSSLPSGIAITASSGDSGYGTSWPAASPKVVAVGGTSLVADASARGWGETVWSGAGSGCSKYESKPSWQTDIGCTKRTIADVSAIADPNTGVAVYDSFNEPGWMAFGGTSVSAPLIASVYALAGHSHTSTAAALPYANPSALFDVTSGSNGSCSGSYLCTGKVGYDGPTGLGTPKGTGAF